LDIELNGQSLKKEEISSRDKYWKDTFKRWKLLKEHEGFWSRLTARVRQMDDPRLTTGFVRRLRESLPYAILQINASLALKAAGAGNKSEASRQINLMNGAGFGKEVVSAALKHVTNPLRNRIKIICKSYSDEIYPDKESELAACKKLLENTSEILDTIDLLLPPESTIKEGAHDEVALAGISMAISYANETDDWKGVLPFFEELRTIVIGESAKNRLENNYEIFKRNIEYDSLYNTCFFCKQNKADESAVLEKPMYGDVRRNYDKITWRHLIVKIPRCEKCNKEHNKQDTIVVVGVIASIAAGIYFGNLFLSFGNLSLSYVFGFIIGGIGIGVSIIIGSKARKTKSRGTSNQFPQVKELKKEGWKFGEEPNTN